MKKVIAIVAVVVVALVGLTSYNGKDTKKNDGSTLIAELKSGGGVIIGGGKKNE